MEADIVNARRQPLLLQNGPLALSAMFHVPDGEGPYPAVLIVHGYGGNKVGYRRRFVHLAERLASLGIATLRLDLRACGDSEGLFSEMTLEGLVSDILAGLKFLSEQPVVSKIGLLGSSFGGAIAVRAATLNPVSSLALWSAVADGAFWHQQWKGSQEALNDHLRCGEDGIPEKLHEQGRTLRANLELGALTTLPVFSAHGRADPLVLFSHQELYKQARAGSPLDQFVTFPKADHLFSDDETRKELIEATARWFQKTLA